MLDVTACMDLHDVALSSLTPLVDFFNPSINQRLQNTRLDRIARLDMYSSQPTRCPDTI